MTTLAYLDCPTGIAGDMCLAALIHAGVPLDYLSQQLERLVVADDYQLHAESVHRNGQEAIKLHVQINLPTVPTPNFRAADPLLPTAQGRTSDGDHRGNFHQHDSSVLAAHHASETESNWIHAPHSHTESHASTRHLPEIEQLIHAAKLPPRAEMWSLAVFRKLAEAEGAVHGISPEQVHFHEVGATDAIVDIVGTCLGLDWLGIDYLYCSALPTGGGTVRTAHGCLPVPVPAVLKLWEMRQIPIYSNGIERELVTPTGAAIATTLATHFGPPPAMVLQRVGLGAGSRDLPIPNILRLWIGKQRSDRLSSPTSSTQLMQPRPVVSGQKLSTSYAAGASPDQSLSTNSVPLPLKEAIALLQTQIDDLNPQAIGYLFDKLFSVGALDVFTQPIGMKKSRPGILLSVICQPTDVENLESLIFRETTTLGIRRTYQERTALHREFRSVSTPYGDVKLKIARFSDTGEVVNVQPEYEDCARLAQAANVPWREIHQLAHHQWHLQSKGASNH
jgi:uncharacterized protein (TIGR00299 family) protein